MKFVNIKNDSNGEFVLNLDFVYCLTKENRYEEQGLYNFVEIPNEFNYFVQLKNGVKFNITLDEYEKIKKLVL